MKNKNIMNYANYIKIFLKGTVMSVAMFFLSVSCASAQQSLDVAFEPNPLFEKLNFLPGDSSSGTIMVTNNSGVTQKIITEAINGTDPDGLGSVLGLRIFETSVVLDYYDNSLGHFLSSAGEVDLSPALGDGETAIYTYEVTFGNDVEDYQNTTLGFDICIGFFDVAGRVCGDTVIGDENETDEDDGRTEGPGTVITGSGGGGFIPSLTIRNESTTNISINENTSPPTGVATIEWWTNLLATSQVIYGLADDGAGNEYIYTLDLFQPNFGYPLATVEDTTKVTQHLIELTGLMPDRVYKYRVVSRASPATISYERTFFVEMEVGELLDEEGEPDFLAYVGEPAVDGQFPSAGQTGLSATGHGSGGGTDGTLETEEENEVEAGLYDVGTDLDQTGSILKKEDNTSPLTVDGQDRSKNLASVLAGLLGGDWSVGKIISILLLLVFLFLVWRAFKKTGKTENI